MLITDLNFESNLSNRLKRYLFIPFTDKIVPVILYDLNEEKYMDDDMVLEWKYEDGVFYANKKDGTRLTARMAK